MHGSCHVIMCYGGCIHGGPVHSGGGHVIVNG